MNKLLKVPEVAKRLGISKRTVWRWIKDGKLKVYRLGEKTIRIDEKDLEAFMVGAGASAKASKIIASGTDSHPSGSA
jgi:excisionase family DNA binding protein